MEDLQVCQLVNIASWRCAQRERRQKPSVPLLEPRDAEVANLGATVAVQQNCAYIGLPGQGVGCSSLPGQPSLV